MIYEIEVLPPRAGEAARPVTALLNYFGLVLATPFSWQWIGWTLFAGLVIHFSSRLLGGRASMAQMLGLTCLAAAPQIFTALTALFTLLAVLGRVGALDTIGTLLGGLIALWSAVVYVKATAVAQQITWLRSLGAIALGFGLVLALALAAVILLGLIASLLIGSIAGRFQ
jgi:hypothetical protein